LTGLTHITIQFGSFPFTANFWIALAVSGVLALVPAGFAARAAGRLKAEEKRKQQEAEAKRREEEERWRNMPLDQRLAVIEQEAQVNLAKRKKELQAAKREYSSLRSQFGGKDPETAFLEHMGASGDAFSAKFKDFYSDSGVQDAQFAMMGFQDAAKYAVAGLCAASCEARQEDAKLTANRRKAVEYAGELKEIYAKLTANQKKREITSEAENLKIGAVHIKIPDAVRGIEKLSVQLADGRKENLLQTLKGYPEFRKTVNLGNSAVTAGAYLAAAGMTFALGKWSDAQEIKQKLFKKTMSLFEKIGKTKTKEVKVKAFTARAKELTMALEKAMEAYAKMFGDIYDSLYPEGDEEKSKAEREKRKAGGGTYFSDEESEAVTQLFTAGKFLLQLADTPFGGDDAENADEK
jgi:hypothetical protein